MFGLFSRKDAARKSLIAQFDRTIEIVMNGEQEKQAAVGHSINMAHSIFIKKFGSADKFMQLSHSQKVGYLEKLTAMEDQVRDNLGDPIGAVGIALIKMWVCALAEKDNDLIAHFSGPISTLSAKAEMLGG